MLLVSANSTFANDDMTAEDVLNHSNEAMEDIQSFSSMTMLHQVISDEVSGEVEIHSEIEQDVILDPFKLHQVVTTSLPDAEEETVTSYWTDEGYFMEDPEGGWMKIADGSEDMEGMAHHPSNQLGEFEAMSEDLTLSEEDNYYVVTYNGDGEELTYIMNQAMNDGMNGEDMDMMEDMLGDVEVHDFSYEVFIDMDTHYISSIHLEMDMEIEAEGETATIEQMMDMNFHNYDSVEDFDVPQEVVEGAQGIDEMLEEAEEGDELPNTATNHPMFALGGLMLAMLTGGVLFFRRRTAQE